MTDMNGKIIMVNRGSVNMHGYKNKEELIGQNAFEYIEAGDKEKLMNNMKNIISEGGERDVEYKLMDKSGNLIPVKVSCSVLKDEDGKPKGLLAVGRSLAESKSVEKALQESEELYRTLIETSPDSISMVDLNGKMIMSNPATCMLYGHEGDKELIGKDVLDLVAPQDRERAAKEVEEIIKSGKRSTEEYTVLTKEGDQFHIEATTSLIKDLDGNPKALMSIARDITRRKKVEEALAAEKESLAVTLRSIRDGVITVDTNGKIDFLNKVAEDLTGWTMVMAAGLPLDKVVHIERDNKRVDCNKLVTDVIESGEAVDIFHDNILKSSKKTKRIVNQSCAPIRDKENRITGVVLIIRDITEKQKLERELFKSKKLESIGILAGGIAHDFNNILTGITSNLFKAKMSLPKDSIPYNSILSAEKAAFRASRLTNQLLTFSRGGEPIKESQSIREIIEDAVGFSLHGSNVDCNLELPDDLWHLEIDRGQIDQVINNLILNADQAMPDGGTITVKGDNIIVSEDVSEGTNAYLPLAPGDYVRISVKDNGAGIHPEDIDKIYDPYFTTKEDGSGLGLTICYSILKKHNGLIFVKSRLGVGTTFLIYLPASKKEVGKQAVENNEAIEGSGKILVMDDEDVVRIAAGQVLKSIGYDVEFAKNGQEVIDLYTEAMNAGEPFDVIIMDLTVPGGMGGRESIEKLLKIDPDVKAIVSSGYSNDPVMAEFGKYGFKGVVAKPYKIDELHNILQQVME
jgi:PAS domain S-box-containing protein